MIAMITVHCKWTCKGKGSPSEPLCSQSPTQCPVYNSVCRMFAQWVGETVRTSFLPVFLSYSRLFNYTLYEVVSCMNKVYLHVDYRNIFHKRLVCLRHKPRPSDFYMKMIKSRSWLQEVHFRLEENRRPWKLVCGITAELEMRFGKTKGAAVSCVQGPSRGKNGLP